jgi:RNA recognition motif-containing protein
MSTSLNTITSGQFDNQSLPLTPHQQPQQVYSSTCGPYVHPPLLLPPAAAPVAPAAAGGDCQKHPFVQAVHMLDVTPRLLSSANTLQGQSVYNPANASVTSFTSERSGRETAVMWGRYIEAPADDYTPHLDRTVGSLPGPTPTFPGFESSVTKHPAVNIGPAYAMPATPPQARNGANLLVTDLPADYTHARLRSLFSQYGEVISVNVSLDPRGRATGKGFALMASPAAADEARRRLHETFCDGARIRVFTSELTRGGAAISRTLFVRYLPRDVDNVTLNVYFRGFAPVADVRVRTQKPDLAHASTHGQHPSSPPTNPGQYQEAVVEFMNPLPHPLREAIADSTSIPVPHVPGLGHPLQRPLVVKYDEPEPNRRDRGRSRALPNQATVQSTMPPAPHVQALIGQPPVVRLQSPSSTPPVFVMSQPYSQSQIPVTDFVPQVHCNAMYAQQAPVMYSLAPAEPTHHILMPQLQRQQPPHLHQTPPQFGQAALPQAQVFMPPPPQFLNLHQPAPMMPHSSHGMQVVSIGPQTFLRLPHAPDPGPPNLHHQQGVLLAPGIGPHQHANACAFPTYAPQAQHPSGWA